MWTKSFFQSHHFNPFLKQPVSRSWAIPLILASSGGDPISKFTLILSDINDKKPTMFPYLRLSLPLLLPRSSKATNSILNLFSLLGKTKAMGARMRVLVLVLAVLMMLSSCMAANRKITKVDVLKHDHRRQLLLDDGGNVTDGYPPSSVNNHHFIPRQDFNNYPGGGGDGND